MMRSKEYVVIAKRNEKHGKTQKDPWEPLP
jgi:hypothetical protein